MSICLLLSVITAFGMDKPEIKWVLCPFLEECGGPVPLPELNIKRSCIYDHNTPYDGERGELPILYATGKKISDAIEYCRKNSAFPIFPGLVLDKVNTSEFYKVKLLYPSTPVIIIFDEKSQQNAQAMFAGIQVTRLRNRKHCTFLIPRQQAEKIPLILNHITDSNNVLKNIETYVPQIEPSWTKFYDDHFPDGEPLCSKVITTISDRFGIAVFYIAPCAILFPLAVMSILLSGS